MVMNEKNVRIKINNKDYQAAEGQTLLAACKEAGIDVPTLCYLQGVNEEATCSVCVVEVKGARTLMRSCVTLVRDGMEILTNTERVRRARRLNMELLLAGHSKDCFTCDRNQTCHLRKLAFNMGIREVRFPKATKIEMEPDTSGFSLVRDPNKCILCRRCISVCSKIQSVNAIDTIHRGKRCHVSTFMDQGLAGTECINCGQCLLVCPTGAIVENNATEAVWKALNDKSRIVIVEAAPAVRAAIGEEFGMPAGSLVTGKLAAGLRRLGFFKVFDTQFSADLTIMEEGYELIDRLQNKGALPLITSCSPGWVKFAEHFFPGILDNISTCKSPQQMFGVIAKTYYAEKLGIDPRKIVVVSVMPCTAKKFEARRPEMNSAFRYWKQKMDLKDEESFPDVDHVLTTREAARMMKEAGINFVALADENFDEPLGVSTGAGVIFGATGGVMEAALRTTYEVLTKQPLGKLEFHELRGLKGIKTAEVNINGLSVKVAVAHGLINVRHLIKEVQRGESPYAFIEIMSCPGGCIGGGGQPLSTDVEIRQKRIAAIYQEDTSKAIRKSHENPAIISLYSEFLGKPLGELSHHLLHTYYAERNIEKEKLLLRTHDVQRIIEKQELRLEEHKKSLKFLHEQLTASNKSYLDEQLAVLNKNYLDSISFVSHELKAILSSLVLNVYTIKEEHLGSINPKQKKVFDSIARHLDYFSVTVRNFFDLGRIEKGELVLRKIPLSLKEDVFDSSIEIFSKHADEKGMEIVNEIESGLKIEADADLLSVVANNLIGNAVKYGQASGRIIVHAQSFDHRLQVEVYSDGRPFEPSESQKLFKKFSRLEAPETKASRGTGLGLFITKEIIKKHQGRIWTEARQAGNAFIFQISK